MRPVPDALARTLPALALCLLAAACAPREGQRALVVAPLIARDADSGMTAVYTPGARNVRVLQVQPPSIVLLREVFVPAGEAVTGVRWAQGALIVETNVERLALDPHTWQFTVAGSAPETTASARARRRS